MSTAAPLPGRLAGIHGAGGGMLYSKRREERREAERYPPECVDAPSFKEFTGAELRCLAEHCNYRD